MAVDVTQIAPQTAEAPVAEPVAQAPITPDVATPAPETPSAQADAPVETLPTETPKPTTPDMATRVSALEQARQELVQERDFYRTNYEAQTKAQAAQAEKADDYAFENYLIDTYRPRLAQVEQAHSDRETARNSPEYKSLMHEAWLEHQAYELDKKTRAIEGREQAMLKRAAELGRDQFYQAASVTHKVPLATLQRILPRTDNINVVDAVARAYSEAVTETTRRLSAQNRLANGTDLVPTSSSGTGGLGIQWMEDAEAANSAGKLTWPQFEALRARLTYKDGTRPSY